ncbi:MAG: hypothetical protein CML24_09505 [Rhizobiales bacterium]|nr:hypothetical protein [Hyphomicrobiales bacterium]|tara:strand:- start:152 stop:1018 length:867 start_codon:yes stop_codon:yes gene_type:complete
MLELEEISVSQVPAFYQHAYDRILYQRYEGVTPARSLTAIGLYNVITCMLAQHDEVSIASIGREIGMTYAGLLKTARYLECVGLIEISRLTVASPFIEAKKRAIRQLSGQKHVSDCPGFEEIERCSVKDVPALWCIAYNLILKRRGPGDTAVKSLKCIGLLNVIARMAACNATVTKTLLAERLDLAAHSLTPYLDYLVAVGLIRMREQRARASNSREYRIEMPRPVIEHALNSLRQLERELKRRGWVDALRLREMARAHRKRLLEARNEPFVPISAIRMEKRREDPRT